MVIGGIAVIAHGVQRMTMDIDAVIRGNAVAIHAAIIVAGAPRRFPIARNPALAEPTRTLEDQEREPATSRKVTNRETALPGWR